MNGNNLKDAINRTFGKPPVSMYLEEHPLCMMGIVRKDDLGYEVSDEDWSILSPLLYATRRETFTFQSGNEFFVQSAVLHVAHITLDGKSFIKVEDERKNNHEYTRQYLLDIVDEIGMWEE